MLQRVGGSVGTVIIAVVLQAQTQSAHTVTVAASGFAHTYWWVMIVTGLALVPTVVFARIERQARRAGQPAAEIPVGALAEAA